MEENKLKLILKSVIGLFRSKEYKRKVLMEIADFEDSQW